MYVHVRYIILHLLQIILNETLPFNQKIWRMTYNLIERVKFSKLCLVRSNSKKGQKKSNMYVKLLYVQN